MFLPRGAVPGPATVAERSGTQHRRSLRPRRNVRRAQVRIVQPFPHAAFMHGAGRIRFRKKIEGFTPAP